MANTNNDLKTKYLNELAARIITGKDVTITVSDNVGSSTNGQRVIINADYVSNKSSADIVRGILDHELFHVRYTNMEVFKKSYERLRGVINALEDVRLDHLLRLKGPGYKNNSVKMHQYAVKLHNKKKGKLPREDVMAHIILYEELGLIEQVPQHILEEYLKNDVVKKMVDVARPFYKKAANATSTEEVYELAVELDRLWYGDPPPPPPPMSGSEGQNEENGSSDSDDMSDDSSGGGNNQEQNEDSQNDNEQEGQQSGSGDNGSDDQESENDQTGNESSEEAEGNEEGGGDDNDSEGDESQSSSESNNDSPNDGGEGGGESGDDENDDSEDNNSGESGQDNSVESESEQESEGNGGSGDEAEDEEESESMGQGGSGSDSNEDASDDEGDSYNDKSEREEQSESDLSQSNAGGAVDGDDESESESEDEGTENDNSTTTKSSDDSADDNEQEGQSNTISPDNESDTNEDEQDNSKGGENKSNEQRVEGILVVGRNDEVFNNSTNVDILFKDVRRELNYKDDLFYHSGTKDLIEVYRTGKHEAADDRRNYNKLKSIVNSIINGLIADFSASVESQLRSRIYTRQNSGRLDQRRVAKFKTDTRLFYRKTIKQDLNTAFSLLVDISGSMLYTNVDYGGSDNTLYMNLKKYGYYRNRMTLASISALIFAELLHRLNVPFEVSTHTEFGGATYDVHESAVGKPLANIIIKQFSEDYNKVKHRMGALPSGLFGYRTFTRHNNDHLAIIATAQRLIQRRENRKVLIVFSDGLPNPNKKNVFYDEKKYLVVTVNTLRNIGVEVYSFGIGEEEPIGLYGKDYGTVLLNLEDFTLPFFKKFTQILKRGIYE